MSENPFASPQADLAPVQGVRSGKRQDLRVVAIYQRRVLLCLLIYLMSVVSVFFFIPRDPLIMRVGFIATQVVALVGTVLVFMLASKVFHIVVAVLLALLTLVPILNFIVLFAVNGVATDVLKRNGIRVGLLGAKLSQL